MRARFERNVDHLACCRHLEVQRFGELRLQARDIVIADVTAVFAQMRRDAVGTRFDRKQRGFDGIGMFPASRSTDGGDVIDVDAEAEGVRRHTSTTNRKYRRLKFLLSMIESTAQL